MRRQPRFARAQIAPNGGDRQRQQPRGFFFRAAAEIAQLDHLRLPRIETRQFVERAIDRQNLWLKVVRRGDVRGVIELEPDRAPSALLAQTLRA